MKRFACWASLLLIAAVMTGCEKEEEEPVIEAPPPPTPQQILDEITSSTGLNTPLPPPGTPMPPGAGQSFLDKLRQAKAQHSQTEEGQEALKMLSRRIDDRLRQMEQAELWEFVLALAQAHDIFNPGSKKFASVVARAEIELRKPQINVGGIVGHGNTTTAMLEFYLPLTKEIFKEQLRVGERMHGLLFKEVFGNNKGVVLRYEETGEEWTEMVH